MIPIPGKLSSTTGHLGDAFQLDAKRYVDVREFGADVTGATNSRIAFLRALAFANGLSYDQLLDPAEADYYDTWANHGRNQKLLYTPGIVRVGGQIDLRHTLAGIVGDSSRQPHYAASCLVFDDVTELTPDAECACIRINSGNVMGDTDPYRQWFMPGISLRGIRIQRVGAVAVDPRAAGLRYWGPNWAGGAGLDLRYVDIRGQFNALDADVDFQAPGGVQPNLKFVDALTLHDCSFILNAGSAIYLPDVRLDVSSIARLRAEANSDPNHRGAVVLKVGSSTNLVGPWLIEGCPAPAVRIVGSSNHVVQNLFYQEGVGTRGDPVIEIEDSSMLVFGPLENPSPAPLFAKDVMFRSTRGAANVFHDGRRVWIVDGNNEESYAGWAFPTAEGHASNAQTVGARILPTLAALPGASASGVHYTSAFEEATVFGTSTLGAVSLTAASTAFEWPQAITAGDTLLVAFCAANSVSSHPMGWAIEVKVGGTWTSGLASGTLGASAATQYVLALKHTKNLTDVRLTLAPYEGSSGAGCRVSPIYWATFPAAYKGTPEFSVPALLARPVVSTLSPSGVGGWTELALLPGSLDPATTLRYVVEIERVAQYSRASSTETLVGVYRGGATLAADTALTPAHASETRIQASGHGLSVQGAYDPVRGDVYQQTVRVTTEVITGPAMPAFSSAVASIIALSPIRYWAPPRVVGWTHTESGGNLTTWVDLSGNDNDGTTSSGLEPAVGALVTIPAAVFTAANGDSVVDALDSGSSITNWTHAYAYQSLTDDTHVLSRSSNGGNGPAGLDGGIGDAFFHVSGPDGDASIQFASATGGCVLTFVFDGTLTGNARLKVYRDGSPLAPIYAGTMPSTLFRITSTQWGFPTASSGGDQKALSIFDKWASMSAGEVAALYALIAATFAV